MGCFIRRTSVVAATASPGTSEEDVLGALRPCSAGNPQRTPLFHKDRSAETRGSRFRYRRISETFRRSARRQYTGCSPRPAEWPRIYRDLPRRERLASCVEWLRRCLSRQTEECACRTSVGANVRDKGERSSRYAKVARWDACAISRRQASKWLQSLLGLLATLRTVRLIFLYRRPQTQEVTIWSAFSTIIILSGRCPPLIGALRGGRRPTPVGVSACVPWALAAGNVRVDCATAFKGACS